MRSRRSVWRRGESNLGNYRVVVVGAILDARFRAFRRLVSKEENKMRIKKRIARIVRNLET